ncbi:hypothetical protein HG66A1_20810 [Gimesia chilikensis]|uniref:Uncharacterized protein n=1 Tax=Gimesia chilikensis TaxID=2605989 RepID=A0A517PLP7_9PLAN|nr:hypothetical protein HG66A1_20810 [Gimesia chilikensis]
MMILLISLSTFNKDLGNCAVKAVPPVYRSKNQGAES